MKKILFILFAVLMTANPVFAGNSCQTFIYQGMTHEFNHYVDALFLSEKEMVDYAQYYLLVGWYDFIPKANEFISAHSDKELDEVRHLMDCIVKKKNIKLKTYANM